MARVNEVIEPRTHTNVAVYRSWLRRIGRYNYRFKVTTRTGDGYWEVEVAKSMYNGRKNWWEPVHNWSGFRYDEDI